MAPAAMRGQYVTVAQGLKVGLGSMHAVCNVFENKRRGREGVRKRSTGEGHGCMGWYIEGGEGPAAATAGPGGVAVQCRGAGIRLAVPITRCDAATAGRRLAHGRAVYAGGTGAARHAMCCQMPAAAAGAAPALLLLSAADSMLPRSLRLLSLLLLTSTPAAQSR